MLEQRLFLFGADMQGAGSPQNDEVQGAPQSLLTKLIEKQQRTLAEDEQKPRNERELLFLEGVDESRIFSQFERTQKYALLLHTIDTIRKREGNPEYWKIRGKLMEEVGIAALIANKMDSIIIPPADTIDFYSSFHTQGWNRPRAIKTGLQTSLEHISVPDGLVVKEGQIEYVIEVTSRNLDTPENFRYLSEKCKTFELDLKSLNRQAGERRNLFSSEPKILFVTPNIAEGLERRVRHNFPMASIVSFFDWKQLDRCTLRTQVKLQSSSCQA